MANSLKYKYLKTVRKVSCCYIHNKNFTSSYINLFLLQRYSASKDLDLQVLGLTDPSHLICKSTLDPGGAFRNRNTWSPDPARSVSVLGACPSAPPSKMALYIRLLDCLSGDRILYFTAFSLGNH